MSWLWRVLAVALVAVVALGVYGVVEPVALFGYDGAALKRSLRDEAGVSGPAECKPRGDHWLCYLSDGESDFAGAYRLEAGDDGCWTATPVRSGKPPIPPDQRPLDGCVDLTDIIL